MKYWGDLVMPDKNADRYSDIIELPHHVSKKHKPMPRENRAAQFSPFAALTGYDAEIKETSRLTDEKAELNDDMVNDINKKLQLIKDNIDQRPEITVEYFAADEKKVGGAYVVLNGAVRRIDEYNRTIVFENGNKIPIDDLYKIDYPALSKGI